MVALKILRDETGQPINSWTLTERLIFCEKYYISSTRIKDLRLFGYIYIYIYPERERERESIY